MNFNSLLENFLTHLKSFNFSKHSVYAYKKHINYFLKFLYCLNVNQASELLKKHIQGYQEYLSKYRTKKGLPITPQVQNRRITSVRNFLRYLSDNGLIIASLVNVLRNVKEPKLLPTSVLEHREMKKVLNSIDTTTYMGYRNRTMLELLYSCGIRAGEIVGLNLSSVDFKNKTMAVHGKGSKDRVVPIGNTALKFLETYVKAVRPFLLKQETTNALFINHYGRRLLHGSLLRIIHRYFDEKTADMIITPHTFRRSCATELIRNGANLYHVKDLLGHEDLQSLKAYTKLTINDLKRTHSKFHPREKD